MSDRPAGAETGFTGTLEGFLEWLQEHLPYGGARITRGLPGEQASLPRPGKTFMRIELVTGGYSKDEQLLGDVRSSVYFGWNWVSTHAGGLYVYEVFEDSPLCDPDKELEWLGPENGVVETFHRARTLRVTGEDGAVLFEHELPHGVELSFLEPKRDILTPAGDVVMRLLGETRDPFAKRAEAAVEPAAEMSVEALAEELGIDLEPDPEER